MKKLESVLYERPGQLLTESGILMLTGEFSQQTIMPLVARLMEYNLLPESLRPEFITLIINSPGGAVHSCFHLIDVMKSSKIPIHTVGQGLVASCGVLTLMAGAKGHRSATHNTSIMSHTWSSGTSGSSHDIAAMNKEFEHNTQRMLTHYQKCTGKSASYISKHLTGTVDTWLTPEEALKHNIIDMVKETY
jgi:ATP-dependent Clp protease protease subunit